MKLPHSVVKAEKEEEKIIVKEGKIMVKEFIQGLVLGFLAGILVMYFVLA